MVPKKIKLCPSGTQFAGKANCVPEGVKSKFFQYLLWVVNFLLV